MKKNKKSAGIIYTVKCEITGEFYVGATTDSLHQRKLDHQERANRGEKHPFAQAIATHGADAFTWEQTYTAITTDELARKEKEFIEKLNSKETGYNSDSGGSGIKRPVYQYNTSDGSLVGKHDCLESAANAVNAKKTSIGNVCIGQNKTCKGYYWSYTYSLPFNPLTDNRKKRVYQYTLSGRLVNKFESVAEASKASGISKTCIARVCRGEREITGGYIWSYVQLKNVSNGRDI